MAIPLSENECQSLGGSVSAKSGPVESRTAEPRAVESRAGAVSAASAPRRAEQQLPTIEALWLPTEKPIPPAQRLVVLVPDADVNESELAARIWALASPRELAVFLIGNLYKEQDEFRARRRLATLAAITRDDTVHVKVQLVQDSSWVQAVETVWEPGDLIVCHAEQTTTGGLRRQPLSQALMDVLHTPVCVLSGFYPELPSQHPKWLTRLLAWLPPLMIIVIFFLLQVRITQDATSWVQTVMLCLSVCLEFALIAAWEYVLSNLN